MSKSGNCTICGNFIPDISKAKNAAGFLELVFGSSHHVCGTRCLTEYRKAHPTRTSKWWVLPFIIGVFVVARNENGTDVPDPAQVPLEAVGASASQGSQSLIAKPPEVPKAGITGRHDWTNSEGKTISANIEGMTMDFVTFRLPDGTRSEYPLKKLSAASQSLALQIAGLAETQIVGFGKVIKIDEGDTLNVRLKPSSSAEIVGKLRWNMEAVPIIGAPQANGNDSWLPILITHGNGLTTGWVHAAYLAL